MENAKDNPGIRVPPPLFYAAVFLLSILLQRYFPVRSNFFHHSTANITGAVIIVAALCFIVPALFRFFKTNNTVITVKPATSLQTSGIYAVTRNPMYAGVLLLYLSLAFIFGNWWTLFLLPVLIFLITYFIILPEEKYLMRAFGNHYSDYKRKVRRWI